MQPGSCPGACLLGRVFCPDRDGVVRESAVKKANDILSSYGTTVFEVMSRLAMEHGAINLGQGFPDEDGPEDVRRRAATALMEESNQYPSMWGVPALRQAVAAHDRHFYGLDLDWQSQVMVTSGATEALTASILALVNPGDEVVLFEPLYDCYLPIVRLAGAVPRLVRLDPPHWRIDPASLSAAFSERTKLILFNTPMNPTGKVFSREELELIAALVRQYDCYAICDEVYEHLIFDGRVHEPLMTLPGMAERCVRIASAGKTFSLTGWKVGYISGAAAMLSVIAKAHQFLTFTTPPNLQHAVAYGLAKPDAYFTGLAESFAERRDFFAAGLGDIGFEVSPCGGTYFLIAGYRPLGADMPAEAFCRLLTEQAGVAAIPVSAFYNIGEEPAGPMDHYVRFCFCKRPEVLEEALSRLRRFSGQLRQRAAG